MPATRAAPDTLTAPVVRGTILVAFWSAAVDLWGEDGLRQVGDQVSKTVHDATVASTALNMDWFDEAYVIEWYAALWNGPCGGRKAVFFKVLRRMLDLGFGRVQRVALRFAGPGMVLDRAPSLWRHDHSHGTLAVARQDDGAELTLSDHPYTRDSLSCLATAEIYRYCLSLSRVKMVTSHHYRQPNGDLTVKLAWTA